MRRIAAVVLILCAGCASPGSDSLIEDSLFGDLRALFSDSDHSPGASVPVYTSPYASATAASPPAQPNK